MNSSDSNYVANDHEDVDKYGWFICNTILDNAMLKLSCKFGESKWNLCWLIMLRCWSGTNYVLSKH